MWFIMMVTGSGLSTSSHKNISFYLCPVPLFSILHWLLLLQLQQNGLCKCPGLQDGAERSNLLSLAAVVSRRKWLSPLYPNHLQGIWQHLCPACAWCLLQAHRLGFSRAKEDDSSMSRKRFYPYVCYLFQYGSAWSLSVSVNWKRSRMCLPPGTAAEAHCRSDMPLLQCLPLPLLCLLSQVCSEPELHEHFPSTATEIVSFLKCSFLKRKGVCNQSAWKVTHDQVNMELTCSHTVS